MKDLTQEQLAQIEWLDDQILNEKKYKAIRINNEIKQRKRIKAKIIQLEKEARENLIKEPSITLYNGDIILKSELTEKIEEEQTLFGFIQR